MKEEGEEIKEGEQGGRIVGYKFNIFEGFPDGN
jgi:hypothetical protein